MSFKGVIPLGIRFPNCKKLSISGNVQSTQGILRTIDPAHLEVLEHLNLTVSDAEEELTPEKPSHMLTVLRFIEQIKSVQLTTVRINFSKVHLGHIITAFSPSQMLSSSDESSAATSNVVFNKVSKLVQISTKSLILPMQFIDDLDLTSSAFLSKHYSVSHQTRANAKPDSNYVHYLIQKRKCESAADKRWAVSLRVAHSITFDFNEELL